jgi:hypothetical protein
MWRPIVVLFCLPVALVSVGCGKSNSPSTDASGPDKVVKSFLQAVCSCNEQQMFELLTDDARKGLKENGLSPGIEPSDSTTFEVTEFEMVDDGAHVGSYWIESYENGTKHKTPVVWKVHKEHGGWRVAGMAMRVFDDMRPIELNFERPDEMIRTQQLIDQEIARREQGDQKSPIDRSAARPR